MVKKHKGGRRQILQLEDKKQQSRNESEPTSTASSSKEESPLDSQVADFFKEIDALTVNENVDEGNSEATCSNSDVAPVASCSKPSCSKQKDPEDSVSQDGLPERSEGSNSEEAQISSEVPEFEWQEIRDENSGYNYYWNTLTNVVTWECPQEYIIYLKNLQSSQFGLHPQPHQSNSNENHRKPKKKKEPPHPPEGAIIPISYFGGSSEEESPVEEKESRLDTTSKCRKADAKYLKKSMKRNKEESLSERKKESRAETMGPHLPHDNNISKHVSSASRTSYLSKEAETSTKNEVEEYFEIGPQLPSNSLIDLSKNSDCNTVSDSSSKCASVSHSYTNGPTVASTTFEEPWEVSLMNIDRKFRGLDHDIGEESPDSTVRKGDNLPENNVPCQTSNDTCGVRGVVEYDNFTDDEEEMSSSNISSSKQETFPTHKSKSGYKKARQRENVQDNLRQFECNKSEVTQSETQRILPKRRYFAKVDECEDLSCKKEKLDIDSLFTNHSNNKYGFGFSRQDKLNLESDFFCSTSSHHQIDTSKGLNDYKAISFVKSDHVFDLSTVNKKNSLSGNSSPSESCRNNSENDFDSENIYRPGPSGLNGINDLNSKDNASNKSSFMKNEQSFVQEKSDLEDRAKQLLHCNAKTSSLSEKRHSSGQKDVSSSRTNGHFRRENSEDLDRALCKAVEAKAKKSEILAPKPSSSSSVSSNQKCKTDSSVAKKANTECAKSVIKTGSLSDDIVNLSAILIDKLTFLISNHSTLTSLSSLLIQIQTRLIDWQAGSLETKYFMSRLQEVQQYLQHYEVGAVSGDWTCQWDRENKRYFYLNSRTQQSQWTYPDELCGKENSWMPSSTDMASTSASSEISVERDELQTVSSSVPEGQLNKSSTFKAESSKGVSDNYSDSSAMWLSESSPPPPPPGVDSPPPPPPHSPPPDSPPPPPPDSTEVEDLLEDMDIENSDDSNPTLIVTNSRANTPSDNHMQFSKFVTHSPERSSENFTSASLTNAVSSTSLPGFEDMNIVSKSPQLVSTSRDTFETADSVNMHWSMSQPSCSTDIVCNFDSESEAVELSDQKSLPSDKDSEMTASSSSRSYVCSNDILTYRKPSSPYPSTSSSSSTISRKEKKKTKLSSGLALKKKNIPSLVEKWQKIKEQQDKEDKNPDDPRNSNSF